MKNIWPAALAFAGTIALSTAFGSESGIEPPAHHHHGAGSPDKRISLELSPEMKQHQLSNMREHLAAVQAIVRAISENKFEDASKVAHARLGLTPEMQQMCGMFGNEKFTALGLAFHRSGDELGETLKTGNMNASLQAMDKTMSYCVECHATFRQ